MEEFPLVRKRVLKHRTANWMGDNERLGSNKTDSIKYQDAEILFEKVEGRAALAGAGNENPVVSGRRAV